MGVEERLHIHILGSPVFEISHRICLVFISNDNNDDDNNDDDDDKYDYDDEEKICTETHGLLLYLPMHYLTPYRLYLKIITKLYIGVSGWEKQGFCCGGSTRLPPNKM